MADVMPDYFVSQQRLRAEITQLEATMERQKAEIMELDSRRRSIATNIFASIDAIKERREKLASLVEAHGEGNFDLSALLEEVTSNG